MLKFIDIYNQESLYIIPSINKPQYGHHTISQSSNHKHMFQLRMVIKQSRSVNYCTIPFNSP